MGILYFVTGIGSLRGAKWGWIMELAVSILALVRNLVEAAGGGVVFAIPRVIVALVIIYYPTRPEVKIFFGKNSTSPAH